MNIIAPAFPDSDAFLRWNEGREGKRELVHGRVVEMMVGATRGHVRLVARLAGALAPLEAIGYEVLTNDLGVRTPAGIRYPDLLVDTANGNDKDLAAEAPVLIAEVLSPSSIAVDLVEKAEEYCARASLLHYIVLAQDEPQVRLWSREDDGWRGQQTIEGTNCIIDLPRIRVSFPLGGLDARISQA